MKNNDGQVPETRSPARQAPAENAASGDLEIVCWAHLERREYVRTPTVRPANSGRARSAHLARVWPMIESRTGGSAPVVRPGTNPLRDGTNPIGEECSLYDLAGGPRWIFLSRQGFGVLRRVLRPDIREGTKPSGAGIEPITAAERSQSPARNEPNLRRGTNRHGLSGHPNP